MNLSPLNIGKHDVQLFAHVAHSMSNQHFQGLQMRSAGVQRRIDTGGELLANVAASDVWLGRVALVDIKPPSLDKLASPSPLELRALKMS